MTDRDQSPSQPQRAVWTTPVLTRVDASEAEQNSRQRVADGGFTTS